MSFRLLLLAPALFLGAACGGGNGGDNPPGPGPTEPIVPTRSGRVVIYEAYPGMFGTSATLNAIGARLDEIADLGVNVLWLMPIYEQGQLKAVGSPYCVKDYKKVNTAYGTFDDLKTLVTAAHTKGMRVILDWVGNHTSWDNVWITDHPDWYTHDGSGNIISPPGFNWTDVADLDYSNNEMRAAMTEAMKWWVTEAGIDGYRADYAEGVPLDFWTTAIGALRTLKGDDLFMLAEGGSVQLFGTGFDMIYAWDFAATLRRVYAGGNTVADLYRTAQTEQDGTPAGKHRMRHITNHDMNLNDATPSLYGSARGAMSAWVIAATMGQCPMIYSSQEVGYAGKPGFFNNYTMDWAQNPAYLAEYEKIMAIREAENALQSSGTITTVNAGERVACYVRSDGVDKILVAVNTSPEAATVGLPIDFAIRSLTDLVTDGKFETTTTLSLGGYEYRILKH